MSRRSVAVLYRKLRELEDAAALDVRVALEAVASAVATELPVAPASRRKAIVVDGLTEMASLSSSQGVLLMQQMSRENMRGIRRDIIAIESNTGATGLSEAVEGFEIDSAYVEASAQAIQSAIATVTFRLVRECESQFHYAERLDDDPEQGWIDRVSSPKRNRKPGRSGVGVLYSMASVVASIYTNVGYPMVNYQRQKALEVMSGATESLV